MRVSISTRRNLTGSPHRQHHNADKPKFIHPQLQIFCGFVEASDVPLRIVCGSRSWTRPKFPRVDVDVCTDRKVPRSAKNKFLATFETFGTFLVLGSVPGTHGSAGTLPNRKVKFDAYRPDRAADGGDPAEALWRNRTRRVVADGRADRARPRSHAVCQRRLGDLGAARGGLAARVAARRLGARSECAAYADAGAGLSARRRFRFSAFPSRLLSVLAVLPAADAVRHDFARPA